MCHRFPLSPLDDEAGAGAQNLPLFLPTAPKLRIRASRRAARREVGAEPKRQT